MLPRLFCQHQFRKEVFQEFELQSSPVRIGSHSQMADVVLESNFIPGLTAELILDDSVWFLQAACSGIVFVGMTPLSRGDRHQVGNNIQFRLNEWICELRLPEKRLASGPGLSSVAAEFLKVVHSGLLRQRAINLKTKDDALKESDAYLTRLEEVIIDLIRDVFRERNQPADVIRYVAGEAVRSELLALYASRRPGAENSIWNQDEAWMKYRHANLSSEDELGATIRYLEPQIQTRSMGRKDPSESLDEHLPELWKAVQVQPETQWYLCERHFVKQIKDIIFGFGPLEDLLRMQSVSEIMVVDSDHIYIERSGVIQDSGRRFISNEVTCSIIERIVDKVGRQINKSRPLVDARLSDGSRVNAVIEPITVSGPCLTIRKFPSSRLRLKDLQAKGAITESVRKFLEAAVTDHRNILIAGGTGTGKTTLLNALSDAIDSKERIVTVEDTAELQIGQQHVVKLQAKPANTEGTGAYTIRDLVKNALRMRPDRIVVGECRGPEALDMLQAMNTGHAGSMTTIHANTPADVISRLEVLVQTGNDINLPISSIYQQISSAIDLIVQLTRMGNGRRVVTQVTEVTGMDHEGKIQLRDLFVMSSAKEDATLVPTGRLPTFIQRIADDSEGVVTDPAGFTRKLNLDSFYT